MEPEKPMALSFSHRKTNQKVFGVMAYTFYRSLFAGTDGKLVSSSWDNRHLVSSALGYKFRKTGK